jgi:hypothetical protein
LTHFFGLGWPKLGLMNALPLQFLMLIFAGWVNRHQQDVIGYLQEENRALRSQLGGKRLRFTENARRYIERIEALAETPAALWGVDPGWEETIIVRGLFTS